MSVSKPELSKPPAVLANPDLWEEVLRNAGYSAHVFGL